MTLDIESKLASMLGADMIEAERNMIFRDPDGGYNMFGRWHLTPGNGSVEVRTKNLTVHRFHKVRSAVSWCIAQKYHQHELSMEICRLDRDLERLCYHDELYQAMIQRVRDPYRRSVTEIKAREANLRRRLVGDRLARCVSRAKYLQTRGFNDEIARTQRAAPNRTNRPSARKSSR
jgi:phosphoenolpyruvate carboxylase